MAYEIFKEFTFEAAHHLGANVPDGHPYGRLHGHSFHVRVSILGDPNPETGWVEDFDAVNSALSPIREQLDHNYLNDIKGLERPTLETIAKWIFDQARSSGVRTTTVEVRRGTCGEGCRYSG